MSKFGKIFLKKLLKRIENASIEEIILDRVHSTESLYLIGKLRRKDLEAIRREFKEKNNPRLAIPATNDVNSEDRKFAKRFGVDVNKFNGEDFCNFQSIDLRSVKRLASKLFGLSVEDIKQIQCSLYYIQNHRDISDLSRSIFFCLRNSGNHRILAKKKEWEVLTPKVGDIIFLNTKRDHAVLPGNEYESPKNIPRMVLAGFDF